MTNEIELLQLVIREYKLSHRILKISTELLEYLDSTAKQIIRHADKNGISLENRHKLLEITEKSTSIIGEINQDAKKSQLGIFDMWNNKSD